MSTTQSLYNELRREELTDQLVEAAVDFARAVAEHERAEQRVVRIRKQLEDLDKIEGRDAE